MSSNNGPRQHLVPAILSIRKGRVEIRKLESNKRGRKPIDIFLSALPKDVGEAWVISV
jgi:hypothetical protein